MLTDSKGTLQNFITKKTNLEKNVESRNLCSIKIQGHIWLLVLNKKTKNKSQNTLDHIN